MNNITEALNLAKEALVWHNASMHRQKTKEAIAAIDEALGDYIADADKMVGCAYCNNPLFAGTKCNNCGRVTLADPAINLNCKSVQKRLATSWGYVQAEPVKQERYFCERCGKRVDDSNGVWQGIHTCTPPADVRDCGGAHHAE